MWEYHQGLWCKHTCTALPFKLGYVNGPAADEAAKLLCVLKGYSGFSYGGKNFFFIPGETSESKCEEELEAGQNDHIYTYLRSGRHSMQADFSPLEESDVRMLTDS